MTTGAQDPHTRDSRAPEGVAVVFHKYMPDGPSYTGRVEVRVHDNFCLVTTWDEPEQSSTAKRPIEGGIPSIAQVIDLTDDLFLQAFNAVSDEAREGYLGNDIANLDRERVKAVSFADGVKGSIMLWGECCFVSVLRFEASGGTEFSAEVSCA